MDIPLSLNSLAVMPCVYALRTSTAVYVGQTENLVSRLAHHRSAAKRGEHPRAAFNHQEFTCEILAVEFDESVRKELERQWIRTLGGEIDLTPLGTSPHVFKSRKSRRISPEEAAWVRSLEPQYGDDTIRRAAQKLQVSVATIYAIRKGRLYKNNSSSQTSGTP